MPFDYRGTPVAAKRRKKKASAAPTAACSAQATPADASSVLDSSAQKMAKKKKKKRPAEGRADLLDGAACAASSSTSVEPVEAAATTSKADALDDIFASLPGKKAARDAQKRVREEQEALDEVAAAAAAKKRLSRQLPRDPIFGEAYDPEAVVNPMLAPVHRVDQPTGYNVYKAHALGLGRGGDTALCPFDCKCCY